MTFIVLLSIVAAGALAAYVFRDKLENFLPGLKLNLFNGALALAGFTASALTYVSGFTVADLVGLGIPLQTATTIIFVVGIINVILSAVTKRAPPEPAPTAG